MSGNIIFNYQKAKSNLEEISKNTPASENYSPELGLAYYRYKQAAEEYIKELQFILGNKVG